MNVWILAVTLVVMASANAGPVSHPEVAERSAELLEVWQSFQRLISGEKFTEMLEFHLLHDDKFNEATMFFCTEEFKGVLQTLHSIDDMVAMYDYLAEAGMDTYKFINEIHDVIGLPHLKPRERKTRTLALDTTEFMVDFLEHYKSILPKEEIKALHDEMLKTSPAFAKFVRYFTAPSFYKIIENLRANDRVQEQLKISKDGGIDINVVLDLYAAMVGLEFPSFERV